MPESTPPTAPPSPNVPAVVPDVPGNMTAAPVLSAADLSIWTSGQVTTESDKLLVYRALNGEILELRKFAGGSIPVRLVVGHWTKEVERKDGMVERLRRFVFITPDGEMFSCSGCTIPRAVAGLLATFGNGPWEPPVLLKLRLVKTGEPEPMVAIDCDGRAPAAPAGKGGKGR